MTRMCSHMEWRDAGETEAGSVGGCGEKRHMSTHVLDKELAMTLNHGFFSKGFLYWEEGKQGRSKDLGDTSSANFWNKTSKNDSSHFRKPINRSKGDQRKRRHFLIMKYLCCSWWQIKVQEHGERILVASQMAQYYNTRWFYKTVKNPSIF